MKMRQDYELLRPLQPDGSIALYRRASSQEVVVIKKIPMGGDSIQTLQVHENAYKEMAINHVLQKHKHDGIVGLLDEFAADGMLHLVFEYCPGGDLLTNLAEVKGAWTEKEIVPIFKQIVAAVAHLHKLEIAHCDISLENVLVTASRGAKCVGVKLCDFGLALHQTATRYFGVGKLYYMSPEMHLRRPYNVQAGDRWALGVLLFMLLTGRPLFEKAALSDANFKTFFEAQAADPSSGVKAVLTAANLSLSDEAVDLLTRLLRPSPQDRLPLDQVLGHAFFKQKDKIAVANRPHRSLSSPVTRLNSLPRPTLAQIPLAYYKTITSM